MPGGAEEAAQLVAPILTKIAAVAEMVNHALPILVPMAQVTM